MTCKDCLHNEMCYATHTDDSPTCCDFKDRSRYVVREKGEWRNNKDGYPECDRCGYMPQYDPMIDDIYYSGFCPNCGADMRRGENDG